MHILYPSLSTFVAISYYFKQYFLDLNIGFFFILSCSSFVYTRGVSQEVSEVSISTLSAIHSLLVFHFPPIPLCFHTLLLFYSNLHIAILHMISLPVLLLKLLLVVIFLYEILLTCS